MAALIKASVSHNHSALYNVSPMYSTTSKQCIKPVSSRVSSHQNQFMLLTNSPTPTFSSTCQQKVDAYPCMHKLVKYDISLLISNLRIQKGVSNTACVHTFVFFSLDVENLSHINPTLLQNVRKTISNMC